MQASGHPIGVRGDNSAPDGSRIHTLSDGFFDCSASEGRKSLIGGEAMRIRGAEGLLEAPPEVRQPHGKSLPAAPKVPQQPPD